MDISLVRALRQRTPVPGGKRSCAELPRAGRGELACRGTAPPSRERKPMAQILPRGARAPEFTLHVTPDQTLSLAELRGKPVVLAFYPADWSPVCGDQMSLYNEVLPEFRR